ncbi:MAG: DUF4430 domain-containing protein [Oscillospiraceae bacterium]|nr:DUF4430 domain-containing protein [Oscillospiraceae bacterium]
MKKKKRILFNSVMVAVIAMIVAAAVLGVGYIRGWFGDGGKNSAALADARGIVNVTRNGVTYPVERDTPLRKGDVIACTPGSSATVRIADGSALAIGEQAVLTVEDPSSGRFSAGVGGGELFAFVTGGAKPVKLSFELGEVTVEDAVVSLSVRKGAQDLRVFSGRAGDALAGQAVSWVSGEEPAVSNLQLASLNAFSIAQLRGANSVAETCVSNEDLDYLEAVRRAEKEAQSQAEMAEALEDLELEHECTVTVVCSTILDNWDKLETAKQEFVPEDGVILAAVRVPFSEGETAFDVTKRACDAYGIQLEYSWTPLYDSYYVEGINHLYEFDCGAESGWMYKVNGWFPNYGASSYPVEEGDAVIWEYTCVGLGADIGGYTG